MTATVRQVAGQGYRAVCDDEACRTKHPVVTIPWRTWVTDSTARAASLAADHNRTRHGAK